MTSWLTASLLSALSALLTASVWMHLRLRAEFRALSLKAATRDDLIESTGAVAERVADLESRIQSIEESRADHSEWVSQAESLNLNRRGQVLRLHRRGDSVVEIASALRVGHGEVKLMIKIYEICQKPDSRKNVVDSFRKWR